MQLKVRHKQIDTNGLIQKVFEQIHSEELFVNKTAIELINTSRINRSGLAVNEGGVTKEFYSKLAEAFRNKYLYKQDPEADYFMVKNKNSQSARSAYFVLGFMIAKALVIDKVKFDVTINPSNFMTVETIESLSTDELLNLVYHVNPSMARKLMELKYNNNVRYIDGYKKINKNKQKDEYIRKIAFDVIDTFSISKIMIQEGIRQFMSFSGNSSNVLNNLLSKTNTKKILNKLGVYSNKNISYSDFIQKLRFVNGTKEQRLIVGEAFLKLANVKKLKEVLKFITACRYLPNNNDKITVEIVSTRKQLPEAHTCTNLVTVYLPEGIDSNELYRLFLLSLEYGSNKMNTF